MALSMHGPKHSNFPCPCSTAALRAGAGGVICPGAADAAFLAAVCPAEVAGGAPRDAQVCDLPAVLSGEVQEPVSGHTAVVGGQNLHLSLPAP